MVEDFHKGMSVRGKEAVFAGSKAARVILSARLAVADALVYVNDRVPGVPSGSDRPASDASRRGKERASTER
jgi:hypothetical protein